MSEQKTKKPDWKIPRLEEFSVEEVTEGKIPGTPETTTISLIGPS